MSYQLIDGGVTAPKGFQAAGVYVGIKGHGSVPDADQEGQAAEVKKPKNDMAMIFSTTPCRVAGTFTTNVVKAGPVKWDSTLVKEGKQVSAVVVNTGVANACTGEEGYGYCRDMASETAKLLGLETENVFVASTGVIGRQLPMDKIKKGIGMLAPVLKADRASAHEAALGIMTTDTKPKEVAVTCEIGGVTVTVAGMCKGSGMIHPNMATMLCFITTDAAISAEMLQKALSNDVPDTFNMISVDGDTSTNDSVLLMANGQAGNPEITAEGEAYDTFCEALHVIMVTLSRKIAGDGEGCTCLFEVTVNGADTKANARTLAKSVVMSNLTKAAIFGHDANWGRILCALGYSGVQFDPEKVDLTFKSKAGEVKIVENGVDTGYSEELATAILSEEEVFCICDMKMGDQSATAYGCDLTYEYVKINGDYRS